MSGGVRNGSIFLFVSVLILILDQYTKYLCVNYIEYGTWGIEITPFFNLVHVYNYGAAFSFLADMGGWQRYLFSAIAIILSLVFIILLKRTPRSHTLTCLAYALFIGGALGNLIDRVFLGYVVDFLLFYIYTDETFWAYPAFNVADIAVCLGAFFLIVTTFFKKEDKDENKDEKSAGADRT